MLIERQIQYWTRRCMVSACKGRPPRKNFMSLSHQIVNHRSFSTSKSGQEHHEFFQEQLKELEKERQSFFGEDNQIPASPMDQRLGEEQHKEQQQRRHNMSQEEIDEMNQERESLFQFSNEEKQAWGQVNVSSDGRISSQLLQEIEIARKKAQVKEERQEDPQQTTIENHHSSFSHVTKDGASVHMVDVGHKQVTPRMAHAQSKVLLPDDVLEAFSSTSDDGELIGPKGPILATAKLAGIMAAKKTSDLIPLCHPLPLDQVQMEIKMQGNQVIIDCTCRVTHKTGVEMEALTGATVAALTIYDMVKAVSHQVQIIDTRLIAKKGGKRTIEQK